MLYGHEWVRVELSDAMLHASCSVILGGNLTAEALQSTERITSNVESSKYVPAQLVFQDQNAGKGPSATRETIVCSDLISVWG